MAIVSSGIEPAQYTSYGPAAVCELSFGPRATVLATDAQTGYTAVFHDSHGHVIGHVTIEFDAQCRPSLTALDLKFAAPDYGRIGEADDA